MTKTVPPLKEPTVQPVPDTQMLHRPSSLTEEGGTKSESRSNGGNIRVKHWGIVRAEKARLERRS